MKLTEVYLNQLYTRLFSENEGAIAEYIPELKKTPKDHFAISYATASGEVISVGDFDRELTLQSLSKPFVYGLALEDNGSDSVHEKVGVEPTGEAFNSIIELEEESHRPFNPMINSGAIATSSMIHGDDNSHRLNRLLDFLAKFVDHPVHVDVPVYLSEKRTGDRNRAIAYLMKNFGILEGDIESLLDLYFQQCSVLMSTTDMAKMGSVLANGGLHPKNGQRLLQKNHVKNILSLMMTCGMYDSSGKWVFEVGLPAKSGVSGVVMAIIPGVGAIAATSPLIDKYGHSIKGVKAIQKISEDFGLNIFSPKV